MKQKLSYPQIDPATSEIVNKRTDDQKMASILRISAQILTKDELECWNELAEQYLENATRYESWIPKIRADMLAEIKQYRISEKAEQQMEDQLKKLPLMLILRILNLLKQNLKNNHQMIKLIKLIKCQL